MGQINQSINKQTNKQTKQNQVSWLAKCPERLCKVQWDDIHHLREERKLNRERVGSRSASIRLVPWRSRRRPTPVRLQPNLSLGRLLPVAAYRRTTPRSESDQSNDSFVLRPARNSLEKSPKIIN